MQVTTPIQLVFPPSVPHASSALSKAPSRQEAEPSAVHTERSLAPTPPLPPQAPAAQEPAPNLGVRVTISEPAAPAAPAEYKRNGLLASDASGRLGHESESFARQAALAMQDYYHAHPRMGGAGEGQTPAAVASDGASMVSRFWSGLGAVAHRLHATA